MTADQAVQTAYHGGLVDCTPEEYHTSVREALQVAAGKYIDSNDHYRAIIAMREVARLDALHGVTL
jgi:hypothetical protein